MSNLSANGINIPFSSSHVQASTTEIVEVLIPSERIEHINAPTNPNDEMRIAP